MRLTARRLRRLPAATVLPASTDPTRVMCCPCCAVLDDRVAWDDSPCGRLCVRCRGLCSAIPFAPPTPEAAGIPPLVRPYEDEVWTRQL